MPEKFKGKENVWVAICFRNYHKCYKEGNKISAFIWRDRAMTIKKGLEPPFEQQYKEYKKSKNGKL